MNFELAQVNVSRLLAPLDSALLAPFVSALDEVNAEGDRAPGFGWDVAGSHGVIVNLTTWRSVQSLSDFIFSGRHLAIMRRRREWFHPVIEATTAPWWVPAGIRPTVDEAEDRVRHLRVHGHSEHAFTLRRHYPAPDAATQTVQADDDRFCST